VTKKFLHINDLCDEKGELLCRLDGKARTFVVDNRAKREFLCEARSELLCLKVRAFVQGAKFCAGIPKCLSPKELSRLVHIKVRSSVLVDWKCGLRPVQVGPVPSNFVGTQQFAS
jgi:hypothetical protein